MNGYQHFAELPEAVRAQILSEAGPADPEAWVHQPIPAMGGRSFLELIDQADGQAAVNSYLTRLQEATIAGPQGRQLRARSLTPQRFRCTASSSEWMGSWIGPLRNPGRLLRSQQLIIDGDQLRISTSAAGFAATIVIVAAISVYAIFALWPIGLVFLVLIPGAILLGRTAPYDLRTARVRAARVFPLSTEIDGFEVSTEAGGRSTLVWAVDIAAVTKALSEIGVTVSENSAT